LTVLGFARLRLHQEEIAGRCNGQVHSRNPGVQLLESCCGMTMHGDRPGVIALLRSAPDTLVQAYTTATQDRRGGTLRFFREAFDRTADPCLEGRVGRICEYLEKHALSRGVAAVPPWEDVSVKQMPASASVEEFVGEHLRVFVNECTWHWAERATGSRSMDYEEAKRLRFDGAHANDFARICNAATFAAHMRAAGLCADGRATSQDRLLWEVQTGAAWQPFEPRVNALLEEARLADRPVVECCFGPKGWRYVLDLRRRVQRKPKSGRERALRCAPAPGKRRRLSPQELNAAIRVFVEDLVTLPPAPS